MRWEPYTRSDSWTGHCVVIGHGFIAELKSLNQNYEAMESALKVIHTWASFRGGELLIPKDVISLCEKVLEK